MVVGAEWDFFWRILHHPIVVLLGTATSGDGFFSSPLWKGVASLYYCQYQSDSLNNNFACYPLSVLSLVAISFYLTRERESQINRLLLNICLTANVAIERSEITLTNAECGASQKDVFSFLPHLLACSIDWE